MSESRIRIDRSRAEGRQVDGDLVIYDLEERSYLGGNRAAAVLWPLLVEGTDLEAMAEALRSEFAIEESVARGDAEAFAVSLRERGLLAGP